MTDLNHVRALVADQLAMVRNPEIRLALQAVLVDPVPEQRIWDYGEPGERFTCWLIARSPTCRVGIAYCAQGFGPRSPWGLVFIDDDAIGQDAGWFPTLEEAFRDSWLWDEANEGRADHL